MLWFAIGALVGIVAASLYWRRRIAQVNFLRLGERDLLLAANDDLRTRATRKQTLN